MIHETFDDSVFEEDLKSFPLNDRLSRFEEIIKAHFCQLEGRMGQNDHLDFTMKVKARNLGAYSLVSVIGTGHVLNRSVEHINQDENDNLLLIGSPLGKVYVKSKSGEITVCGDNIAMIDLSSPFTLNADSQTSFGLSIFQIPRKVIENRLEGDAADISTRLVRDPFLGIVLKELFNVLAREGMSLDFPHYKKLLETFLDIVSLSLAVSSIQTDDVGKHAHAGLRLAIQRFIDSNLKNPDLNHEVIALQFGVSVRQIHKVFEGKGLTVGQYILNRRLQGAASQLRAVEHAHRKIGDIAFDWCFNELSHFSRAFKNHFGCTAREWRHELRHH